MKFYVVVTENKESGDKRIIADKIWHTWNDARAYYDLVCEVYGGDRLHSIQLHELTV